MLSSVLEGPGSGIFSPLLIKYWRCCSLAAIARSMMEGDLGEDFVAGEDVDGSLEGCR